MSADPILPTLSCLLADSEVTEYVSLVLGSDLVLSVQHLKSVGEFVFYLFDGSGNALTDDGFARTKTKDSTFRDVLPIVAESARAMFPNYLRLESTP